MNILFAEDDEPLRYVYQTFIKRYFPDALIHVADDGLKAWNLIKETEYDIIVTDMSLPEMDGFQLYMLTKELYIAKNKPLPHFVFASGVLRVLTNFNVDNSHKLAKPFSMKELIAIIKSVIPSS